MDKKQTYYITTPIYYPSGNWHLGHCYTTVICDALARFKRARGYDVFYLTGTDEHGQKIEKRAAESKTSPQAFVDKLVSEIKELWQVLNISNDGFIRTTDAVHTEAVQRIFRELYNKGEIYKGEYKGMYCTPCEAFWTESQLKEGKCPDCDREVTSAKEEAYFFRLSKYSKKIEELLTTTDYLRPSSRVNEMVNNFIKPGLEDLCVSRTSFKWGIPVPFDEGHVIYVWLDALTNYITALGAFGENNALFSKFWPCDLHMVGKEIVRFHAIVWPAILMALDLPLPKAMYGHGWLLLDGDKMSKSKGNVVDPFVLCSRYGTDAVRYFLLREVPFGSDGVYSNEALLGRINSDLVNDLGNLVSRTAAMISQYCGGIIPRPAEAGETDMDLKQKAGSLKAAVEEETNALRLPRALEEIFKVVGRANKYIDETVPWKLAKDNPTRLSTVLFNLAESIRICAVMLLPFLPETADKIFAALGATDAEKTCQSAQEFGLIGQNKVTKTHLFGRLDIKKELKELEQFMEKEKTATEKPVESPKKASNPAAVPPAEISIDDFAKIDLRTAAVTACERIEGADKLYKLTVDCGGELRTVVSGIAQHYSPEQLVGKMVVLVANLKPVKLRGVESRGMILCADDDGRVIIVSPESPVASGGRVR